MSVQPIQNVFNPFFETGVNHKPKTLAKKYYETIQKISQEMGIQEKVRLYSSNLFSQSCQSKKNSSLKAHVIRLDPSFFIDPQDVPKEFIIYSMQDTRIQDENFINDFIKWLKEYFKSDALTPEKFDKTERIYLILFLFRASRPELLEKLRRFIIVHELAHFLPYDQAVRLAFQRDIGFATIKSFSCTFTAAYAALYFLRRYKLAYLGKVLSTTTLAAGLVIGLASLKRSMAPVIVKYFHQRRKVEFYCDASAVRTLQDKEGGLYYLNTHMAWKEKMMTDTSTQGLFIDPLRDNPEYWTHPTTADRISRLEKMEATPYIL
jgi:hypothetical protein